MQTPAIESYIFGHLVVDGNTHDSDVIVLPSGVRSDWWRVEGHKLQPVDLEAVVDARPDVLVVGSGAYGRMRVTTETERMLDRAGIELVTLRTKEACQTYNDLRGSGRVAAALHLTC